MPYLRDVVLPECVADFLGPSDALTLTSTAPSASRRAKVCLPLQRKTRVKVKNKTRKQEDLGVAVERGMDFDSCSFYFVFAAVGSCAILHYFCNGLVSL